MDLVKNNGQVFTPDYIVKIILDFAGYDGEKILEKHVIDNSCGDGAFLKQIVERYIYIAKKANIPNDILKNHLETYIHGIEIEDVAYKAVRENLTAIAEKHGIYNVNWTIHNCSALTFKDYDGKMDYVLGNPPYVSLENIVGDETKDYTFAYAATDLYICFYELGLRMLRFGGKLCYITPSRWPVSVNAKKMREHVFNAKCLKGLIHFQFYKVFDALTLTAIALMTKGKENNSFDYYTFDTEKKEKVFQNTINIRDIYINGKFYIAAPETLKVIREMYLGIPNYVKMHKGIEPVPFEAYVGDDIPDTPYTHLTMKATNGRLTKCIYPYDDKGNLIPENEIWQNQQIKEHFDKWNVKKLYWCKYGKKRDVEAKYTMTYITNDVRKIKFHFCPKNVFPYGKGFCVPVVLPVEILKEVFNSDEYQRIVVAMGIYKENTYEINIEETNKYLNYVIHKKYRHLFEKDEELLLTP